MNAAPTQAKVRRAYVVRLPHSLVHPLILARLLALLTDMKVGGPSTN